jgi:hypothetical protein
LDIGGGNSNILSLNTLAEYLKLNIEYKKESRSDFIHYVSNMRDLFSITDWRPTTTWIKGIEKIKEELNNGKNK